MKKFLLVLSICLSFLNSAWSDVPTTTPGSGTSNVTTSVAASLFSRAGLKATCLQNVVRASAWVGGQGCSNNTANVDSIWANKDIGDFDCSDLVQKIWQQKLKFTVVRLQDRIYVNLALYDKDYNMLFYGQKSGYLEYLDGTYHVPKSLENVELEMSQTVYLPLPNPDTARGAQINVRDNKGNIILSQWLPVNNGVLTLPTQYSGQQGELIISRYADGYFWQDWYDLGSGSCLPQQQVEARIMTRFLGYFDYGIDPYIVGKDIAPREDGLYENPLFKFKVVNESYGVWASACLVDANNNGMEFPYRVEYRKRGDSDWTHVDITGQSVYLKLPAGEYQLYFRFHGMVESIPTYVDFWTGGKGG